MRAGDRRPTMADVAAAAGVSIALVSIVMRDAPGAGADTRRRVLQVAADLDYQPDSRARLLRSGRTRLLGVVFGVAQTFNGDLITGLYDAADTLGYELTLSAVTPHRDEIRAIGGLLQDRCEALILLGPRRPTGELAELAQRRPVVAMMRGVRHRAVDVVRTDDAQGLHQAVGHLITLGHRRIAHVDGGPLPGSADRRRGYQEAMRGHGLAAEIRVLPGGSGEADGARAARDLLTDPPTAVTVFNDHSATGILNVFRSAGLRVPEDVSVVGYDDSSLSRLAHIDMTTIAQDAGMLTRLAVARAADRIESAPVNHREIVIPPRLVVRATTGPVRGS